jgi:hypothetical protein
MLISTTADCSGVIGLSIADYRLNANVAGLAHSSSNLGSRIEPDLDVIKQVEQVTTFVLALARIRSIGIRGTVEVPAISIG